MNSHIGGPVLERRGYLDNSSTTRVCEPAAAKVMELMTENYGNPSSLQPLGFRAEQALTERAAISLQPWAPKEDEVFLPPGDGEQQSWRFLAPHMHENAWGCISSPRRLSTRL